LLFISKEQHKTLKKVLSKKLAASCSIINDTKYGGDYLHATGDHGLVVEQIIMSEFPQLSQVEFKYSGK